MDNDRPELMYGLKWFQVGENLVVCDLGYFDKMVEFGEIEYCNSSEQNLGKGEGSIDVSNSAHLRYMERSVKMLIFSFEKTSLVEDMVELGMREKQMDAAANITAQVLTSRLENYEMTERHLAKVKMRMVDTVLKVMEVVGMYEKAHMGGQRVLSRLQLEVEAVLSLDPQV